MKRVILATAMAAIAAGAFAFPGASLGPAAMHGRASSDLGKGLVLSGEYVKAEMEAAKAELGDRPFGELTINELTPYWTRLETALRKDAYVRNVAARSLRLPGAGQFKNGDALGGAGFLAMHLGTIAGTAIGGYLLLPADLRFDKLDYFSISKEGLRTAFRSHSFEDYLPAMGVMGAGMLLDSAIRLWSAGSAWKGAKAAVDSGTANLEVRVGPGFAGMGMRF